MVKQTTIILFLVLISFPSKGNGFRSDVNETSGEPLLSRLHGMLPVSTIQGTMSLEGTMTIGNLPFTARLRGDTISVTLAAPFGMTAGTMFATADTFVVVNYLSREVLVGHPDAQSIASVSPIPLRLSDVRAFMRGTIPGDLRRFTSGPPRTDAKKLYIARDSAGAEFMLIDTTTSTLSQYQRKDKQGKTVLNLVLGDVRDIASTNVAHAIDVDIDGKSQAVRFRFDSVEPTADADAMRIPEAPPSFTRRVYNR
jgi:hypothetical protein